MDIQPFNDFIASLYDDAVVPPVIVLSDDGYDAKEYYERTGCIPVLMEDEGQCRARQNNPLSVRFCADTQHNRC